MIRYDAKTMPYQMFISTVDHIWNRGKDVFYENLASEFEISELTGANLAYLCGLEEYVRDEFGIESTLPPHPIQVMEELTYARGLLTLIEVLGERKREEILAEALPQFMKYGVVVTSVFNAA